MIFVGCDLGSTTGKIVVMDEDQEDFSFFQSSEAPTVRARRLKRRLKKPPKRSA